MKRLLLIAEELELRFLRRFARYRALEILTESDAALIDSLNRYIGALEGRDGERLNHIHSVEEQYHKQLSDNRELRKHLSGTAPQ